MKARSDEVEAKEDSKWLEAEPGDDSDIGGLENKALKSGIDNAGMGIKMVESLSLGVKIPVNLEWVSLSDEWKANKIKQRFENTSVADWRSATRLSTEESGR